LRRLADTRWFSRGGRDATVSKARAFSSVTRPVNGAVTTQRSTASAAERWSARGLVGIGTGDLDSLAATARLRECQDFQPLPVIALTAHALDEERKRCLAAGMDDFVTRPVDPSRLVSALAGRVTPLPSPTPPPLAPTPVSAPACLPDAIAGFDLAGTLERFCGNAAVVCRLIEGFAGRCQIVAEKLDHLEAAVAAGDARAIQVEGANLARILRQTVRSVHEAMLVPPSIID